MVSLGGVGHGELSGGFWGQQGAGCVLIDPEKNKHFLSCRLEFECTNNTTEYEALVQGLKKAIELKVYGDSEIVVKQIRNKIHYISPHLKAY